MIDLPDSNAGAIQEVMFSIEIQTSIWVFYSDRDVQFHREPERHSWFFYLIICFGFSSDFKGPFFIDQKITFFGQMNLMFRISELIQKEGLSQ